MRAAEEVFGYFPVAFGMLRTAVEDVEVAGLEPWRDARWSRTRVGQPVPSVFDGTRPPEITREGCVRRW